MATWTNDQKLEGQTSVTYNETGITYNQSGLQYNGKLQTVWTNDSQS